MKTLSKKIIFLIIISIITFANIILLYSKDNSATIIFKAAYSNNAWRTC